MIESVEGSFLFLLLSATALAASGISSSAHASAQASASASANVYGVENAYDSSRRQSSDVPLHGGHKGTRRYGSVDSAFPQDNLAGKGSRVNNQVRPDCSKCANYESKWDKDEYYEEYEEKNEGEKGETEEHELDDCNDDGQYRPHHHHHGDDKSTTHRRGGSRNPSGVQKVENNQPNAAIGGFSNAESFANTAQHFAEGDSGWNNEAVHTGNSQQSNSDRNQLTSGAISATTAGVISGSNNAITLKPSLNTNSGTSNTGNLGVTSKPVPSWTSPTWSQGVTSSSPTRSPQAVDNNHQQSNAHRNTESNGANVGLPESPARDGNKTPCSNPACEFKSKCNQAQRSDCANSGVVKTPVTSSQASVNTFNVAGRKFANQYPHGTEITIPDGTLSGDFNRNQYPHGSGASVPSGGASSGASSEASSSVPTGQQSTLPTSGSAILRKCSPSGSSSTSGVKGGCSSRTPQKIPGELGNPDYGVGNNGQRPTQLGGYPGYLNAGNQKEASNTALDESTHQWNVANPFLYKENANVGPMQSGNVVIPGTGTTVDTTAATSKPIGAGNPFLGTSGAVGAISNKAPTLGGHSYDQSKDTDTESELDLYKKPIGARNPFFTGAITGIKGNSGAQSTENTINNQGVQTIPSEETTTKPIQQGNPFFGSSTSVPIKPNYNSAHGISGTKTGTENGARTDSKPKSFDNIPTLGHHSGASGKISSHHAPGYPGTATSGIVPGHPTISYLGSRVPTAGISASFPGAAASGTAPSHPATDYSGLATSGTVPDPATSYPESRAPAAGISASFAGSVLSGTAPGHFAKGYPGSEKSGAAPRHPSIDYPGSDAPKAPEVSISKVGHPEGGSPVSKHLPNDYPGIPQTYPSYTHPVSGDAEASGNTNQGVKGHPHSQGIPSVLSSNINAENAGGSGSDMTAKNAGTIANNFVPNYYGNVGDPAGNTGNDGSLAHAGAQSFAGAQAGSFSNSYSGSQASSSSYSNAKSLTYMGHGDPANIFQQFQSKNWPFGSTESNSGSKSWSSGSASSGASAYSSSSAHNCAGLLPAPVDG